MSFYFSFIAIEGSLLTLAGLDVIYVESAVYALKSQHILICEQFNRMFLELKLPYDARMVPLFSSIFKL